MAEEINKSYQVACDMFANACMVVFGIKPVDDDKLILDAAVQFRAYIKTFKRLDLTTKWQVDFVKTMVKTKVNALSKRIIQKYGTHKGYLDRLQRRSGQSESSYERYSNRATIKAASPDGRSSDSRSKEER